MTKQKSLPFSVIEEETGSKNVDFQAIDHRQLFDKFLKQVGPIDFRKLLGLKADATLRSKHFVVGTVRQVLIIAKNCGCNFCKFGEKLHFYNGVFWKVVDLDILQSFLGAAAALMGVDGHDAEFWRFREELLKQFLASAVLPEFERLSGGGPVLINVQNGTLEVHNNGNCKLREPEAADFLTYVLPFAYDDQAVAPKWQKFLDWALPDTALQDVLQEYLGYVFAKNLKLEKCLLCYGSGRNGKSVVFDTINALLGRDLIANFSYAELSYEHNRAELEGKLLCYTSELGAGRLTTDDFKKLVSGEPILVRRKFGHPKFMYDYSKLIFNTNSLPKEVEITDAFFRRILILPFESKISDEEKDPNLAQKIIASELSGVLNWILAGLKRLLVQQNFTRAEAAEKAMERYRIDSDSVQTFLIDEGYEASATGRTESRGFYLEYRQKCIDDGCKPLGRKNFNKRLEQLGIDYRIRSNGQDFVGVEKTEAP
ncbi:phage/plasmid primase, P4 family [Siphonobacter sp. SORGH_AS_1065]|uniref:DNA primase family protein n=1 Tax=Siphonobacter sp. SORGH_AS_1065 TaxID=3041795 RepID=UPI002789E967|nr:phage/plasmid primase, P4 family [Siphonobacter sp. SORGH_AS_1065]MDQ1087175.1 putative DNA primase/helicase [Siphonobacter sp. SORGH_AS_1065]